MPSDQGTEYTTFIARLLKEERERRVALEGRATNLVAASAGLVTITSTATSFVGFDALSPYASVLPLVILGGATLVASGVLALVAGQLKPYDVPSSATLTDFLTDHWTDSETTARNNIGWLDLQTLRTIQDGNNEKAWFLDWAVRVQLIGVCLLAIAFLIAAVQK